MISQVKHSLFSLLFLLQIVILCLLAKQTTSLYSKCFQPCHKHGLLNEIVWVSVAAGTYYFQLIKQTTQLFLDTGLEGLESLESLQGVKSTSVQCDHMGKNIRARCLLTLTCIKQSNLVLFRVQ